nr:MAG TPA: hypothetical protein [Caudoviricetes sp.]
MLNISRTKISKKFICNTKMLGRGEKPRLSKIFNFNVVKRK